MRLIRRSVQFLGLILFLLLFSYVAWPYTARPGVVPDGGWPSHYADSRDAKEIVDAEIFLVLDPLVSISTAVAGRTWVWSLVGAGLILGIGIVLPRGFCGYLCPMGTFLDLFEGITGRGARKSTSGRTGWWVHLKYYLLLGVLAAAAFGVLVSGFVAAIPMITRGLYFVITPVQIGVLRGWHQVPPMNAGHYVSIVLCIAVFALSLIRRRFWCRYVCPTGATFSIGSLFLRLIERKVEATCTECGRCVEACPFDAIKADFTTRTMDCTSCRSCSGVCPTHSIKFVGRWNRDNLKTEHDPPTGEVDPSRRGLLVGAASGVAAALLVPRVFGAGPSAADGAALPLRPPGSVPEQEFLELCIGCGECFQACPNNVLQPLGFGRGLEGLWTPYVEANWAGCEPSCNNCGQVCPTGAIRALRLKDKMRARMGLAVIDRKACLPWAKRGSCQLCVDECRSAGYHAIEFERIGVEVDDNGFPIEDTGYSAPVVFDKACVGCGLCQSACYRINKKEKGLLTDTAIRVTAG